MPGRLRRCEGLTEWLCKWLGDKALHELTEDDNHALHAFAHLSAAWNRGADERQAVAGMAACVALMQSKNRHLAVLSLACFADWPAIGKLHWQLIPSDDFAARAQLLQVLEQIGELRASGLAHTPASTLSPDWLDRLPHGRDWLSGAGPVSKGRS